MIELRLKTREENNYILFQLCKKTKKAPFFIQHHEEQRFNDPQGNIKIYLKCIQPNLRILGILFLGGGKSINFINKKGFVK